MVFSTFDNIDVNFVKDLSGNVDTDTCIWYTIFLGISELENESGDVEPKYEYVCFPETLRDGEDVKQLSLPVPYFHNLKYTL